MTIDTNCEVCGKRLEGVGNNTKYCRRCARLVNIEKTKDRQRAAKRQEK